MVIKAIKDDIEQIVSLDESVIGSRRRESLIVEAVEKKCCYIVKNGDVIAAYSIINDHFFGQYFLELLIVGKTYRRKGVGTVILEYFKDYDGAGKRFTSTNLSNLPMQKLLEKCGFELCGRIDRLDEGDPEIVYCYENEKMHVVIKDGVGLRSFILNMAHEMDFSGVIQIWSPDRVGYEQAFGLANRDWNIPNQMHTRFNTASISKVFTACGIVKLAEQGKLSLNDRLTDYLHFEGMPFSEKITLYHLLTHSSGIADDADEEAGENYEDIFVHKSNYRFRKAADLVENFIGKKPVFEPGSGCRYNNAGYVLLGLVIEKITGKEYKQWLTESILTPWGLTSTFFPSMDEVNTNTAEGYILGAGEAGAVWKKNIYSIPPVGTPEGGIYSTASDLIQVIRGLVEGRFFTPEFNKQLISPMVLHRDYGSFQHWMGLGFEFYMEGDRMIRIQKDGSNPGVSAVISYYPESGTSLALLSNINCNVWEMQRKIDERLGLSK